MNLFRIIAEDTMFKEVGFTITYFEGTLWFALHCGLWLFSLEAKVWK